MSLEGRREGGREGRGGREGGEGRGGEERRGRHAVVGREGGREGREGGREEGMTLIYILIGMFNSNPMTALSVFGSMGLRL